MHKLRMFAVLPVLIFAMFGLTGAALAQEGETDTATTDATASVSGNVYFITISGSGNIVVIGDTINLGDLPEVPAGDDANGDDAVDNGEDATGDEDAVDNGDDANGVDDVNGEDEAVDTGDDAAGDNGAVDNGDANGEEDVDNGDAVNGEDEEATEADESLPFGIRNAPGLQGRDLPPGIQVAPGLNGMNVDNVPGQMERQAPNGFGR